jgi:hypothetical protein
MCFKNYHFYTTGKYGVFISGGVGNGKLVRGEGDDLLQGGLGNDKHMLSQGFCKDEIMNGYHAVSDKDLILFNSSIDLSKVGFKKSGEEIKHIHINVEGSEDRLAIVDWWGGVKLDEIVFC